METAPSLAAALTLAGVYADNSDHTYLVCVRNERDFGVARDDAVGLATGQGWVPRYKVKRA